MIVDTKMIASLPGKHNIIIWTTFTECVHVISADVIILIY